LGDFIFLEPEFNRRESSRPRGESLELKSKAQFRHKSHPFTVVFFAPMCCSRLRRIVAVGCAGVALGTAPVWRSVQRRCGAKCINTALQRNRRYAVQVFCIITSFYKEIAAMRLRHFTSLLRSTKKSPLRGSGILYHCFVLQRNRRYAAQ
jgi:hypothetical protein